MGSRPCVVLSAPRSSALPLGVLSLAAAGGRQASPGCGRARPRGLRSLLVQQVLRSLDKTQQLSNWDRRPLGEGQLVYAGGHPLSCPATPHAPHQRLS